MLEVSLVGWRTLCQLDFTCRNLTFSYSLFTFAHLITVEALGGNDEKVDDSKGSFMSVDLAVVLLSNKE